MAAFDLTVEEQAERRAAFLVALRRFNDATFALNRAWDRLPPFRDEVETNYPETLPDFSEFVNQVSAWLESVEEAIGKPADVRPDVPSDFARQHMIRGRKCETCERATVCPICAEHLEGYEPKAPAPAYEAHWKEKHNHPWLCKVRVTLEVWDDGTAFDAWVKPGENWNGFACPYFDDDTARAILESMLEHKVIQYWTRGTDLSFSCLSVGVVGDGEDPLDYEEKFEPVVKVIDGSPVTQVLYPIGSYGWTWTLVDPSVLDVKCPERF